MEEEVGTEIYRIRKIKLTALDDRFLENGEENSRTISHFHFITWPDFGVPGETSSFLDFLDKTCETHLLLKEQNITSPAVVHWFV